MRYILAQIGVRNSLEEIVSFMFAIVGVIWGISTFLFFQFNRSAALKRRLFPIFVITTGLGFVGFVAYMSRGDWRLLSLAVPTLVLITLVNLRRAHFCDSCGRTLWQSPIYPRSEFCPRCGAELK